MILVIRLSARFDYRSCLYQEAAYRQLTGLRDPSIVVTHLRNKPSDSPMRRRDARAESIPAPSNPRQDVRHCQMYAEARVDAKNDVYLGRAISPTA